MSYEVWYCAPNYFTDKLFIMQRISIRAIQNLKYNTHTSLHFKNLKLSKLYEIFRENITVYFFSTLDRGMNTNVSIFMVRHSVIPIYHTRYKDKLVVRQARKARTQSGFFFEGIKEWNGLPDELKNSDDCKILRRKLKIHYLSSY